MATLKNIDYKCSGLDALQTVIADCRPPDKNWPLIYSLGISKYPLKGFTANKFLHNKEDCSHQFRAFIVCMDAAWPELPQQRLHYKQMLELLLEAAMEFWGERGYQTFGIIHSNTAHPHIHLVLDTCNVYTGEQFPQGSQLLHSFQAFLSNTIEHLGLGEGIPQSEPCITISEEEMRAEDEPVDPDYVDDAEFPVVDLSETDDWFDDEEDEDNIPNYAALDLGRPNTMPMFYGYFVHQPPREMARIVDKPQSREMCRIVEKTTGCD